MILLDPLARPVIGHRGNRAHAPENTLASFQEAVALGVDAIEFDLRVSRDGVLMVFHDATLERTIDATGPFADRTAAELGRVDAGANFTPDGGRSFPWRGRGATVSTFDGIVESLPRTFAIHHRAEDTGGRLNWCGRRSRVTASPGASSSPASTPRRRNRCAAPGSRSARARPTWRGWYCRRCCVAVSARHHSRPCASRRAGTAFAH